MKILVPLAEGFEEIETMSIVDVLRRPLKQGLYLLCRETEMFRDGFCESCFYVFAYAHE